MQDIGFRQAIEKQLNRGENSNKFSKAVAFGNNQEIMFEEKEEQEIAENCRQLIKNAIILWNYLYLVKMLQSDDHATAQYALVTLKKGNVLAWKHILLHGEYDLSRENTHDDFGLADPKIITLISSGFNSSLLAAGCFILLRSARPAPIPAASHGELQVQQRLRSCHDYYD